MPGKTITDTFAVSTFAVEGKLEGTLAVKMQAAGTFEVTSFEVASFEVASFGEPSFGEQIEEPSFEVQIE